MKTKIFILLLLFGGVFGLTSCDKAMEDNFPSEFASVLHFFIQKGESEIDIKLLNIDEAGKYSFSVGKSGNNPSAIAEGVISVISKEELDTYNNDHSTNYVILPDKYYKLSATKLSFTEKENNKKVDIEFQTTQMDSELDMESIQYVIPLSLSSQVSSVNEELGILILKPIVTTPMITLELPDYQKISMNVTIPEVTSQTITMPFYIDLNENKWNFSVEIETDEDVLQSIVDEYKVTNPEISYKLLPSANHNLSSVIEFGVGDLMLVRDLTINRENLLEGDYLFPVKLKGCIGQPFEVNDRIVYVHLSLNNELPKIDLNAQMLSAASENLGEGRPLSNILDGNSTTFWQNAWQYGNNSERPNDPKYGIWLDIKLDREIDVFTFAYQTPAGQNEMGLPKEFAVYVGNSVNDMTKELEPIATFTYEKDQLPKGRAEWFRSSDYRPGRKFKYIRFAFLKTFEGGDKDLTIKQPGSVWLSEFEISGR